MRYLLVITFLPVLPFRWHLYPRVQSGSHRAQSQSQSESESRSHSSHFVFLPRADFICMDSQEAEGRSWELGAESRDVDGELRLI